MCFHWIYCTTQIQTIPKSQHVCSETFYRRIVKTKIQNSMQIPYKNIFDVLRTNRFIVLATVGCSALVCVVAILMTIKIHRESQNNAFVVSSKGDIIPLKIVHQRENFKVEALAHLERFHHYFYSLNANNYKEQIEKALWLSNNSVADLFRQKQAEGVYNRLLQYSLVQKVIN